MDDRALEPLGLELTRAGAEWQAECRGYRWKVNPAWPDRKALNEVRWLVEEADEALPGTSHIDDAHARARALGEALWLSLVQEAPAPLPVLFQSRTPSITLRSADENLAAALSLIWSPRHGWLSIAAPRLSLAVGPERPPREARLRLLLVTARPFDETDAPYLSVAHPLARRAAQLGISFACLSPPRKDELRLRLREAAESGEPFTLLIFDGHGAAADSAPGCVAFESRLGTPAMVDAKEFSALLGETPPPVILLAACRTARDSPRLDSAATFAGDLARQTGSDVIGMNYNIAPTDAATFTLAFVEALHGGDEVAAAVRSGRGALFAERPRSFGWLAPAHFHVAGATLTPSAVSGHSTPPTNEVLRHLDVLACDRSFQHKAIQLWIGVPYVGKSHFLAFYAWWFGRRAGAEPEVICLDARAFETPDALLGALAEPDGLRQRLVVVDNCEHWSSLPPDAFVNLCSLAAAGFSSGVRWLLASRVPLSLPAMPSPPYLVQHLLDLGRSGMLGAGHLEETRSFFFGPAVSDDGWQMILILSLRSNPMLLRWAADRVGKGRPARELLWDFLLPTPEIVESFDLPSADLSALANIDPMLGWGFGADNRPLLASTHFPNDPDNPGVAARMSGYFDAFSVFGDSRLGFVLFESWMISPSHAAALRSRRPKSEWSRGELLGYCSALEMIADLPQILSDTAEVRAKMRERREAGLTELDLEDIPVGLNRGLWVGMLLLLPALIAGAEMALAIGEMRILRRITIGTIRALRELGFEKSARTWASYWKSVVETEAAGGTESAHAELSHFTNALSRLAFASGDSDLVDVGLQRLSNLAPETPGATVDDIVLKIIDAFERGSHAEGRKQLDGLLSALPMVSELGAAALPSIALLERLEKSIGPDADREDRFSLLLLESRACVQGNEFARAAAAIDRAALLASDESARDQHQLAMHAVSIFAVAGRPEAIEFAHRGLVAAKQLGDAESIGSAQVQLATILGVMGDLEGARHHLAEAIPKLSNIRAMQIPAMLAYARLAAMNGDLGLAQAYQIEAEAFTGARPGSHVHLEALMTGATIALQAQDPARAGAASERLLAAALEHGFAHGEAIARWVDAEFLFKNGDLDRADREIQRALPLFSPVPEGSFPNALMLAAKTADALGRASEACELQQRSVREFERAGMIGSDFSYPYQLLELIAIGAGRIEVAEAASARVNELVGGEAGRKLDWLVESASAWARIGYLDRARRRARLALWQSDALDPQTIDRLKAIIATD